MLFSQPTHTLSQLLKTDAWHASNSPLFPISKVRLWHASTELIKSALIFFWLIKEMLRLSSKCCKKRRIVKQKNDLPHCVSNVDSRNYLIIEWLNTHNFLITTLPSGLRLLVSEVLKWVSPYYRRYCPKIGIGINIGCIDRYPVTDTRQTAIRNGLLKRFGSFF